LVKQSYYVNISCDLSQSIIIYHISFNLDRRVAKCQFGTLLVIKRRNCVLQL